MSPRKRREERGMERRGKTEGERGRKKNNKWGKRGVERERGNRRMMKRQLELK